MKRYLKWAMISGLIALAYAIPALSYAEFNININLGAPTVVAAPPPELVLIPGTYVYLAPGSDLNIVFYGGFWYRPHKGKWYRSDAYNGNWMEISIVPGEIRSLPSDWKNVPPGQERLPWGHVKKNWKQWENERHWDRRERKSEREFKEHRHKDKEHKDHDHKGRGRHD